MPVLDDTDIAGTRQDGIGLGEVGSEELGPGRTDVAPAGGGVDVEALAHRYEHTGASTRLKAAIVDLFPGRIALVSSFGAEASVLLHLIAAIDRATPVIFVDTSFHFDETLAYRDRLVAQLGLTNVTTHTPDPAEVAAQDPERFLWAREPNQCCHIRKVLPLSRALDPFAAWISGRKRFQAETRESLPVFEAEGRRVKVNPLADWSAKDLLGYMDANGLPRHPLTAKNYLSIGCLPCTSPVRPGEDARAGRWRGKAKVECGIHTAFPDAGAGI